MYIVSLNDVSFSPPPAQLIQWEGVLLIAGTQSGCGKTTVTLALMQALRARGLRVAPFKAGPDFLDPLWHKAFCGRDSWNLDTRMMGEHECRKVFAAQSSDADIPVIEGVMGMFDGVEGVGGQGSSAHLAKVLDEPVLLVVDAKGMSGSIIPLLEGFVRRSIAMGVRIVGVIANRVGSERHAMLLQDLMHEHSLPPLLAWMLKDSTCLSERHLGLVMPGEEDDLPDFSASFHWRENFFVEYGKLCGHVLASPVDSSLSLHGRRIAVAKDKGFCFLYPANLEWLAGLGAELIFFSPLAGEPVPQGIDALWLPGGYPELHADVLAASTSLASIRDFIATGGSVLAECGGMMVLGETITDGAGASWPMAGVLPCNFHMQDRFASLGYREDAAGVRGHEFHHSRREGGEELPPAFSVQRGDAGIHYKNLRASYIHWYFPSQPDVVAGWLGWG